MSGALAAAGRFLACRDVAFVGPPGSGKGTQCRLLAKRLGFCHLATGEVLREIIGRGNALSRFVAARLDRGYFAPDYLVMQMVAERLGSSDCSDGCVFDGFPRTLPQAAEFDATWTRAWRGLGLVLALHVDQDVVVERLRRRADAENRTDDRLPTVLERMRVYKAQTEPLLEYYSKTGRLVTVDGLGSIAEVTDRVSRAVAIRFEGLKQHP